MRSAFFFFVQATVSAGADGAKSNQVIDAKTIERPGCICCSVAELVAGLTSVSENANPN
jgi:hypothetical protein